MNNYLYKSPYEGNVHLALGKRKYQNGSLAVQAYTVEHCEPYMTVTVNLPETPALVKSFGENAAFVDVNNCIGIESFLQTNGIAEPLHMCAYSGFCKYPAYKFNI